MCIRDSCNDALFLCADGTVEAFHADHGDGPYAQRAQGVWSVIASEWLSEHSTPEHPYCRCGNVRCEEPFDMKVRVQLLRKTSSDEGGRDGYEPCFGGVVEAVWEVCESAVFEARLVKETGRNWRVEGELPRASGVGTSRWLHCLVHSPGN
eukprot:TRINITY_DN46669_c0_g1_i2.p1 TRINITY_DN46669_c0_g1~~TRINITY_DN46669_c0_g1_i2.p1  ORF type:complete len:151 (-),score=32.54 TRINITY_DN46669_c0_g1_i2:269-721(-)